MRFSILIFTFLILISCESALIDDDPGNEFVDNFEEFWNEFDQHYAFFDLKGIDWDAVYRDNISQVQNSQGSTALFNLVSDLILSMEDGHVDLTTSETKIFFDYTKGYAPNDPRNAVAYVEGFSFINNAVGTGSSSLGFGDVKGTDIGYLRITTFEGPEFRFDDIDDVILDFQDKSAIIVDLRSNTGGNEQNARIVASRFVDEDRLFRKIKIRNGPEHTDFTDWSDDFISPDGDVPPFTKPMIVLTNRTTFSSAESFALMMKSRPNTMVVGDVTGGGSGFPLFREMPNGWIIRVPYSITATPDMVLFEEVGLIPDIRVDNPESDLLLRKDAILERAIEELR